MAQGLVPAMLLPPQTRMRPVQDWPAPAWPLPRVLRQRRWRRSLLAARCLQPARAARVQSSWPMSWLSLPAPQMPARRAKFRAASQSPDSGSPPPPMYALRDSADSSARCAYRRWLPVSRRRPAGPRRWVRIAPSRPVPLRHPRFRRRSRCCCAGAVRARRQRPAPRMPARRCRRCGSPSPGRSRRERRHACCRVRKPVPRPPARSRRRRRAARRNVGGQRTCGASSPWLKTTRKPRLTWLSRAWANAFSASSRSR